MVPICSFFMLVARYISVLSIACHLRILYRPEPSDCIRRHLGRLLWWVIRRCRGGWLLNAERCRAIGCAWSGGIALVQRIYGVGVAVGWRAAISMATLAERRRSSGWFFLGDLFLVLRDALLPRVLARAVRNHLHVMNNSMYDHVFIWLYTF